MDVLRLHRDLRTWLDWVEQDPAHWAEYTERAPHMVARLRKFLAQNPGPLPDREHAIIWVVPGWVAGREDFHRSGEPAEKPPLGAIMANSLDRDHVLVAWDGHWTDLWRVHISALIRVTRENDQLTMHYAPALRWPV